MKIFYKNSLYRYIIYLGTMLAINAFPLHEVYAAENVNSGSVKRAIFTTAIKEREPVDQVLSLSNRHDIVYFFSELQNFQGKVILHKWYYENELVFSERFDVKGPRWRVFSKVKIEPQQIGKWKVVIYGPNNWPVKASVFNVVDGNAEQIILPYKQ